MTIEREHIILALIAAFAVVVRAYRLGGVEVFEDGYENYLITWNLYSTGDYGDRISGMTGGNWLPFYHFIGAGLMHLFGTGSIHILWALSLASSAGTVVMAGLIGRRMGEGVGIASALFWAIDPLDMVMSSMTLPDNLALFAMASASYLIVFRRGSRSLLAVGSAAMLVAVMTRYEAWAMVPLLGAWALWSDRKEGTWRSMPAFVPSALFMLVWIAITFDGGIVIGRVIDQTSLQPAIMGERTGLGSADMAALFIFHYVQYILVIVLLAMTLPFMGRTGNREIGFYWAAWGAFWALVLFMIGRGLMVGSYRYLAFAALSLTIVGAFQLRRIVDALVARMNRARRHPIDPEGRLTFSMAVIVVAILMVPSIDHAFSKVDSLTVLNEPQRRAGIWLKENYEGGSVLFDSPIAAFYSDIPIRSIIGSRMLPEDRDDALSYIAGNLTYVVLTDHPHFRIAELLPELRNGTSWGIFKMVYTPNSWEVDFGALPTFVYQVDPGSLSVPVGKDLSVRYILNGTIGAVPLFRDVEIAGGGYGFGHPILVHNGDYLTSGAPRISFLDGSVREVFTIDRTLNGSMVGPIGTVVVYLSTENGSLQIEVEFGWLPVGSELIMVNEVDRNVLGRYIDFAGTDTVRTEGWTEVAATYNYLIDGDGQGFMVERLPGTRMFLGAPPGSGPNDAVGLDIVLSVEEAGPHRFEYVIHPV